MDYIEPPKQKQENKVQKGFFTKIKRYLSLLGIALILISAVLIGMFVTNTDNTFLPITLNGRVVDITNNPVPSAVIYIDDVQKTLTDSNGFFEVSGVEEGTRKVRVEASGFAPVEKQENIINQFLSFNYSISITLESAVMARFSGSFIKPFDDYKFLGDTLTVGDAKVIIDQNGNFSSEKVFTGKQLFNFSSANFLDITQIIEILPGDNEVTPIELTTAGDIVAKFVTYVTEQKPDNYNVEVTGVSKDKISINEENQLRIRDLEVGRDYAIRISGSNIETRDFNISVKQGETQLSDKPVVENGLALLNVELPESKTPQLVTLELDGLNITSLLNSHTNFNNNLALNYFLNAKENAAYYTSQKEKIRGKGGSLSLVYKIDLDTNTETKVTVQTESLGRINANFEAEKLVNIVDSVSSRENTRIVELRDLSGDNPISVTSTVNEIVNVLVSQKSNFIYWTEYIKSSNNYILYGLNLASGEKTEISSTSNTQLWDVSDSGNNIIFSELDSRGEFLNLATYNFELKSKRNLIQNILGSNFQYLNESEETILFSQKSNERSVINKFDLTKNLIEPVIKLSNIEKDDILSVFQQSFLIYYVTKEGVYAFDIDNPFPYKLVFSGNATAPIY